MLIIVLAKAEARRVRTVTLSDIEMRRDFQAIITDWRERAKKYLSTYSEYRLHSQRRGQLALRSHVDQEIAKALVLCVFVSHIHNQQQHDRLALSVKAAAATQGRLLSTIFIFDHFQLCCLDHVQSPRSRVEPSQPATSMIVFGRHKFGRTLIQPLRSFSNSFDP